MSQIFEVWGDEEGTVKTVSTPENVQYMIDNGVMEGECHFYSIRADSFPEALKFHHEIEGLEPYVPMKP